MSTAIPPPGSETPRKARAVKIPKTPKAQKTLTEEMSALLAKVWLPDLRQRARQPAVERALRQHWQSERDHKHTAADFDDWSAAAVEQICAAWILSCIFVRVLEDRGLTERRRIAGEGADDGLQQFLEIAPSLTERDYLLTVFRELATYPGAADVLDPAHNPAWRLSPSNDSVRALLALLRETGADGSLRFRFESADTRFLGDLYQDLSESVRKRYALLQTPDFVERFILDQTLEPAIAEFGLEQVRLIDPTCGSGHFLLGAFHRLFEHRQRAAPATDRREHAKAALAQVTGVDINPYAVAIARFRLTLAYLEHAGIDRLAQAPRIATNLVVADSLLHGAGTGRLSELVEDKAAWGDQMFALDDPEGARRVFGQKYHAVVGNPPYITCKDAVLRDQYRKSYESAAGKYALCAPFTERFFLLAQPGGFVGMINSNSFMKREFGKALLEKVLPRLDLTQVIDTSGAYIPGHGTPTVLLFGRNRASVSDKVLAVMGKRGEPATPEDAEKGFVWSAIASHHTEVGFENDYISIAEVPRETLNKHPWSLGGGGAAELKELLEERCEKRLGEFAIIGVGGMSNADDVYIGDEGTWRRLNVPGEIVRPLVIGEEIRDWSHSTELRVFFPYDRELRLIDSLPRSALIAIWPYRTTLWERAVFSGGTYRTAGRPWYEWHQVTRERYATPLSIAFAFVATHNHFVLDRGGKVFNRTAPIIKLPPTATEDDHLALLAYLNSSTACFYLKQTCQSKGLGGQGGGIKPEAWHRQFEFDGTKLAKLPLVTHSCALEYATALQRAADERADWNPEKIVGDVLSGTTDPGSLSELLQQAIRHRVELMRRMVLIQEELDWLFYATLGVATLTSERLPEGGIMAEERAFELAAASKLSDNAYSHWHAVHSRQRLRLLSPEIGATEYGRLIESRVREIEVNRDLNLLETFNYKRRWEPESPMEMVQRAVRRGLASVAEEQMSQSKKIHRLSTLLATLERDPRANALANVLSAEIGAELHRLVEVSSVPAVAADRFTPKGFQKHAVWIDVWRSQRLEDLGHSPPSAVPEKYESDDYAGLNFWRLRGKLDVPKERFISYPGCERDDDKSPLIGWAGWNHLQRAQALAALFQVRKDQDGWPAGRLVPILAGLLELVPWLKQWYNEPDPANDGQRMGDEYESFVSEKARELQMTLDDLRNWRPETAAAGRQRVAEKKAEARAEMQAEKNAQKLGQKKAVTA